MCGAICRMFTKGQRTPENCEAKVIIENLRPVKQRIESIARITRSKEKTKSIIDTLQPKYQDLYHNGSTFRHQLLLSCATTLFNGQEWFLPRCGESLRRHSCNCTTWLTR